MKNLKRSKLIILVFSNRTEIMYLILNSDLLQDSIISTSSIIQPRSVQKQTNLCKTTQDITA